jgi:hypothetical protein
VEVLEAVNPFLAGDYPNYGIDASWTDEPELWEFLREKTAPELELHLAGARGLW